MTETTGPDDQPISAAEAFPGWNKLGCRAQHRILDELADGIPAWRVAERMGALPTMVERLKRP